MADLYRVQPAGVPNDMNTQYQEIGDNCHGLVVATNEVWRVAEWYRAAADPIGVRNYKEFIIPDHYEIQVLFICVTVTTTGTVGTRQLCIAGYRADGTLIGVLATAGATQAASLTRYYTFGPGLADLTAFRDTNFLTTPIPVGTIGAQTQRLRVFENKNIAPLDNVVVSMQYAWRKVSN
jgi:hypothetical protein